ncbi:ComEC/Rec2 family competence protein [Oceanobacillus massiliensis]|uniref:ComEC/Rec2 family competence protein n=1 Tax=Oceanobacillus massiliensis TaxID=1465765 RepID=UPI0002882C58|nr:ComEC/Rec2 family competence protein [Oceanobacillus massiliensis]
MKKWIAFIIILNLCQLAYPSETNGEAAPEMEIHFIDVGQGDSMFIRTPMNRTILVDGGPPGAGDEIVSYLKKQNIKKLDLVVATHPDMDHIGGLPEVMKHIEVKEILDTGKLHPTKTFAAYINEVRKQSIPVRIAEKDTLIEIDPMMKMEVWNAFERLKNNNESSIVLKITYGEVDLLLMSDVEQEQEKEFLHDYNVKAEIIKVAHHGSKTSSSLEFLQGVQPEVAILTYSKENDYGHPVNRVIENLYRVHSMIYSTAAVGNVVINTDGTDYIIIPEKNPVNKLIESAG